MDVEWFIVAAGLVCGACGYVAGLLIGGGEMIHFFSDLDRRIDGKITQILRMRSLVDSDSRKMLEWMSEQRKKNGS